MQLSANSQAALNGWIGPHTWDSEHHEDTRRFYLFVSAYQKDHGSSLNEADMRQTIKQAAQSRGHTFGQHQEVLVFELVNKAVHILEFLSATGR
jgi:hypothetical protein